MKPRLGSIPDTNEKLDVEGEGESLGQGIDFSFLLFQGDRHGIFAFLFVVASEPVDGLFLTGDFVTYRDGLEIDRDLVIEKRKGRQPVNDSGISLLRPTLDREEGVVMAVEIETGLVFESDAVAIPAQFLKGEFGTKQAVEVDLDPVGQGGIKKAFVVGEMVGVRHGPNRRARTEDGGKRRPDLIEVGAKLVERLVVIIEKTDFALHEAGRGFDVLGEEKNELFAPERAIDHALPIAREAFFAVSANIGVIDLAGFLVIPDQLGLVVRIAGPLDLGSLLGSEGGKEDAEFVLKVVLDTDGSVLQIGWLKEIALAGHRTSFEIAVNNEAFGEVPVGSFVVSFHFFFLALS